MKKLFLVLTTLVFFLLSSCIPSLHPIVTEENRITDNRVIGTWKMEEYTINEDNFQFSVKSDDKEDQLEGIQLMEELKEDLKKQKKYSTWQFERAAKLKFKKLPEGAATWTHETIGGETSTLKKLRAQYNNENIVVEAKEELPYYILTYSPANALERAINMKAELTKIGNSIYMDMFPINNTNSLIGRFSANFIEAHTFVKVEFKDEKLILHSFDIDRIEHLLKSKKLRLKHEFIPKATVENNKIVYKDNIVLTAPTKELRAFLEKYGTDEDLFDDAEELIAQHE